MSFISVFFIAVGLAMDAFSLAICQGIFSNKKHSKINSLRISFTFGFFQFFMPLLGSICGEFLIKNIAKYSNYISFSIFLFLSIMMFKEGIKDEKTPESCSLVNIKTLFLMGIATSIDALLVGLTFSLYEKSKIFLYCLEIGIVTLLISFIGFIIGNKFGDILGNKSNFIGSFILFWVAISSLF